MKKEEIKDLVNPEVFKTVDTSSSLFIRAGKINNTMHDLEQASEKTRKLSGRWRFHLEIGGSTIINLQDSEVLHEEIWEAMGQFISLLEAIHYSERKATIIEFNNSLKKADDGKQAEK